MTVALIFATLLRREGRETTRAQCGLWIPIWTGHRLAGVGGRRGGLRIEGQRTRSQSGWHAGAAFRGRSREAHPRRKLLSVEGMVMRGQANTSSSRVVVPSRRFGVS